MDSMVKPLFGFEKAPRKGFLHTGRRDGKRPIARRSSIQPDPHLVEKANHSRRYRSPACGVWHIMITGPKMKRSILLDSQADLFPTEWASARSRSQMHLPAASGKGYHLHRGTVYKAENLDCVYDEIRLPSYREVSSDKRRMRRAFYTQYSNTDPFRENAC